MKPEHVHLIGIGGTGMASLAGLLQADGCRVTGSDHALYPPTSEILESLGLEVEVGFGGSYLDPAPDLVVVGNAISRGNPEVEEVLDRRLRYTSMPRVIAERFLDGRHSVVVTGTHGKTTTTSMLAWILVQAGHDPSYLIGGQPLDLEHSFRLGGGKAFVIEGDEYDTAFFDKGPKFMHYRPDTAVLGTVEFDHADIYRDLEHVKTAFARLVNLIPRRGLLVWDEDCPVTRDVSSLAHCRAEGFGIRGGAWRAVDLEHGPEGTGFALLRDGQPFCEIKLQTGGEHNVRNAVAAAAAAAELGVESAAIAEALSAFRGVRRRLERRGTAGGVTILDDFAHHPTAVAHTVRTVRNGWPDARVWAVLEPRSWSLRRNVFQERLAESFAGADHVVIADVFRPDAIPEGERLDPERLVADLARTGVAATHLADPESIVTYLAGSTRPGDVIVVMSNGGFEGLHERLLERLALRETAADMGA